MKPERDYTLMKSEDVANADTSDWIAVLPLGAHEQHGPHLPFETDSVIATGIAECLGDAMEGSEVALSFLPTQRIGYSPEHLDFEGSKSLSYAQAIEEWIGIGEELSKLGIRKLLLLNAHGGNSPLMTIVATELRVRFNMLCVATSWTRFLVVGEEIDAQEKAYGIHGGDIETSVMLALDKNQVDMERAENFDSTQRELVEKYQYLRAYGPHAFGWKMQDLNEIGVTGNAVAATAQKGELMISQSVEGLKQLVLEMHDFDVNTLK